MKKILYKLGMLITLVLIFSISITAHAATYKYDDLNRLIEVTYNSGQKITYTYDAAGNIKSVTKTGASGADTQAPTVPTGLTVYKVTKTSAAIKWTASTDNVGVKEYEVYRNGVKAGTVTTPSCTYTGLIPGTTYTFTVKAVDAAGNASALSDGATATTLVDEQTPTAPTGLTATSITGTSVTLTWTASTDDTGIKTYEVYRDGVRIGNTNTTTYTNGGLAPGKAYIYTVKAYDLFGNMSADSNVLSVTTAADSEAPTAPSNLTATATETTVTLTWDASTDNIGVRGYHIFRDGVKLATVSKTTFTSKYLIPGRTYKYTVKAYDIVGNVSEESNAANITTIADAQAPSAPSGLMSSNITEATVTLSWTAATDNTGIKEYRIYRDGVKIGNTSLTTFTSKLLIPGRTYVYTIQACDLGGNLSESSDAISITTVADIQAPTAPSNLLATVTETSATLTWDVSTDNVAVKGYQIFRDGVKICTTSSNTYKVSNLIIAKTYKFTVKAYDLVNNLSSESNVITVTP